MSLRNPQPERLVSLLCQLFRPLKIDGPVPNDDVYVPYYMKACACQYTLSVNGRNHAPTSAAWIILTSFPPSPMQHTLFLVNARINLATSAFCVGEHRQATTADSLVEISMNSFLNELRQSCNDSPSMTRQQSSLD